MSKKLVSGMNMLEHWVKATSVRCMDGMWCWMKMSRMCLDVTSTVLNVAFKHQHSLQHTVISFSAKKQLRALVKLKNRISSWAWRCPDGRLTDFMILTLTAWAPPLWETCCCGTHTQIHICIALTTTAKKTHGRCTHSSPP